MLFVFPAGREDIAPEALLLSRGNFPATWQASATAVQVNWQIAETLSAQAPETKYGALANQHIRQAGACRVCHGRERKLPVVVLPARYGLSIEEIKFFGPNMGISTKLFALIVQEMNASLVSILETNP